MIENSNITQTNTDKIIDGLVARIQRLSRQLGMKNLNFSEDKIEMENDEELITI